MDAYEIEILRRSLAMLSPGQMALRREEALALVSEAMGARDSLRRLRDDLLKLADKINP